MADKELLNLVVANDRLLKALISLLVAEQPERLAQLRSVFKIAQDMQSPIAEMPRDAWREIAYELDVIQDTFGPELH